uniref:Uncharacterized protein n=1 Tax=Odontella aurita TaxID=265563 RepID=A0A7S4IU81_9STRA|mmetsp:Transcript_30205/g.89903  ORF Transcript_30205/g.89903 Transcript_30205/m.89903 type:complete len:139 (+) Transcript_30205:109-525(+)
MLQKLIRGKMKPKMKKEEAPEPKLKTESASKLSQGRLKKCQGISRVVKHTGECEALGNHVLDIGQLDEFEKTIRKMDGFVSSKYDYGDDVCWMFEHEDFDVPDISGDEPSAPPMTGIPPTMNITSEMTWKEKIREYVK